MSLPWLRTSASSAVTGRSSQRSPAPTNEPRALRDSSAKINARRSTTAASSERPALPGLRWSISTCDFEQPHERRATIVVGSRVSGASRWPIMSASKRRIPSRPMNSVGCWTLVSGVHRLLGGRKHRPAKPAKGQLFPRRARCPSLRERRVGPVATVRGRCVTLFVGL